MSTFAKSRNTGKRSLTTALLLAIAISYWLFSRPSHWQSKPTNVSSWQPEQQTSHETEIPQDETHQQESSRQYAQPETAEQDVSHQDATTESPNEPQAQAHSDRPKCDVTRVSMLYGAHKFPQLEEALETHRRHGERWGCRFEGLERDLTTRKLYSKHYFLLSTLLRELSRPEEERQKWLLWVDADSILINPAISPCDFLPPDHLDHVYALVTADHNGLNNGVFYLKVHQSSLDLLTQIAAYPLENPEDDLGWFGEQAAMAKVIKAIEARHMAAGESSGIAWVPRNWFNNYEFEHGFEGESGSFLVHFAGLAETRLSHMAEWLTELQNNQAKWEVPIEQSLYKDAIPDFWKEYTVNLTGKA